MDPTQSEDYTDIFGSALETLYSELPVSVSEPGKSFTHNGITVYPPDTDSSNWSLHASSVWRSAIFLSDHLPDDLSGQEVLELGAGSGLPGLCIAKRFPTASVTLSDYPDPSILSTLQSNAALNGLGNVKVVGHVWGTSTPTLGKFNLIIAADTLWLSEQHQAFLWSFKTHLIRSEEARVLLIAGLHTGRYTIAKFLKLIAAEGFDAECVAETALSGGEERNWAVERHEEQDSDRRRWVVKIILKWNEF